MTAAETRTRVSMDEFLRMPGNEHCEWIDGDVLPMAKTTLEHARITGRLIFFLMRHVHEHGGGVVLSESAHYRVSLPDGRPAIRRCDVSFIATDDPAALAASSPHEGAADLAVEVVSRHDVYPDVTEKVRMWLANGAQLVWVLDHDRVASVYRSDATAALLGPDDALDGEAVLPGFRCNVREIYKSSVRLSP